MTNNNNMDVPGGYTPYGAHGNTNQQVNQPFKSG